MRECVHAYIDTCLYEQAFTEFVQVQAPQPYSFFHNADQLEGFITNLLDCLALCDDPQFTDVVRFQN